MRSAERVEDLHLVWYQIHVHDLGRLGVEALERALWRLGVERARRNLMCREIVEQRARHGCLANAALVRADNEHCWFRHGIPHESIVIHFSPGAVFKQVPVAAAYRYFLAPLWKVIVESRVYPLRRHIRCCWMVRLAAS